jgi:hypothetical protein
VVVVLVLVQAVICVLAPFFLALCCVPDLKYLIPFSLVSNLVC